MAPAADFVPVISDLKSVTAASAVIPASNPRMPVTWPGLAFLAPTNNCEFNLEDRALPAFSPFASSRFRGA